MALLSALATQASGQTQVDVLEEGDTIITNPLPTTDSIFVSHIGDSLRLMMETDSAAISRIMNEQAEDSLLTDTISLTNGKRDLHAWQPSPKRAMWLAIMLPGAGQIYNRKYWKLPIIYGGFIGCFYALRWNNMMYKDYSQGYMDLMDGNPETRSYNQFMHLGVTIDEMNPNDKSIYQNKFKRRKDYFRRYRDMSIFVMIGIYAVSIIDAYVDATLSEFDISDDLSLRVAPSVMRNNYLSINPLKSTSIGVSCSLNF